MIQSAEDLDRWIKEHPRLAWLYTVGACVLIFEVASILNELIKLAARRP